MTEPRVAVPLAVGTVVELEVERVGNGGVCVAHLDGRVVFVRHTLPGEHVRAAVTEDLGGSFVRADAVDVLTPSPDRVEAPCVHAGPGRCGGCDWQHVDPAAQRRLKAEVVREQFARLAGCSVDVTVEELPGGPLRWRTRVAYAIAQDATVGLRRHRSHEIEPVGHCPLAVATVDVPPPPPPGAIAVEVVRGDDGALSVLAHREGRGRHARRRRPPDEVELVDGPGRLVHRLGDRVMTARAQGFWQVHPHALATFVDALLDAARPVAGETVLDLYAGAGPLTAVLAGAVGPTGRVVGLESDAGAVADAALNLLDQPWAVVDRGRVEPATVTARLAAHGVAAVDVAVLDPPRAGAGAAIMTGLLDLAPRCIAYLSCDPATLARDVRTALDAGWELAVLRAFDAFPMTQHVECLAVLTPSAPGASADVHPHPDGA